MRPSTRASVGALIACVSLFAISIAPHTAQGATWQVSAGAQNADLGRQALAFLPNELWIHAGDSVKWTLDTNEIHTVSFMTPSQLRPVGPHRNDVITPDGSAFDGSSFVNSGDLSGGQTYTVKFPTTGNFKLVCLVHLYMNGTIHVLTPSARLPFDQKSYDQEATQESGQLLSESKPHSGDGQNDGEQDASPSRGVTTGTGAVIANGGGFQSVSLMRFFPSTITVHVGQTVEWTNLDPATPHTITFGVEPAALRFPAPIVTAGVGVNQSLDVDGAMHGTVASTTDNVHSGQIFALPADRAVNGPNAVLPGTDPPDLSQYPLPILVKDVNQRFRVTFTHTGTFNYFCALHDDLGMTGKVIVLP